MSLVCLNPGNLIRPYHVDAKLDSFAVSGSTSDAIILELLAYYRGEPVSEYMIAIGRMCCCKHDAPLPLPINSLGLATFECTDETYTSKWDVGTIARHYELIADLLELEPDNRHFKLPFTANEVRGAMNFDMDKWIIPLACINFLRPKRTETYLRYTWPKELITEDFFRFIGRGLEKETRMHLIRLAPILPDEELYPIIDWATRTRSVKVLHTLLEEKAPSVLLWCLINPGLEYEAAVLIMKKNFEDKVPVVRPEGFIWQLSTKFDASILTRALWSVIECCKDSDDCEYLLASLGIVHARLGNDTITPSLPFGLDPVKPDEELIRGLLKSMSDVLLIGEEDIDVIVRDLYPKSFRGPW